MIEYGKMLMGCRAWAIQCLKDFSKFFVRLQKDKSEQELLPEILFFNFYLSIQHSNHKSTREAKFPRKFFAVIPK
jgi:hypothetical protein